MNDDENPLLQCFLELDTPNYELIDDDSEEVDAMVTVMDTQHSYHRPRRLVPRERADGEARIIHHYFAEKSYLPP
jgi:hypothetical protein